MRTPRAYLAALSLTLLPWLHGSRNAPPEPAAPIQQSAVTDAAPEAMLPVAPVEAVASRARPDNDNLLLGNPSNAVSPDSTGLNLLAERPQHSMSYNGPAGGPNWVSWHVGLSDLGRVGRGTFRPDPLLPAQYQIRPNDYRGSGYDRGHVCPSADRTSSRENNDATFVMSNMLPQAPALNQQVWAKLETYARTQVRRGNELYTLAGGVGSSARIGGGKINVPAFCWKIILVLPEGDNDLQRITPETRVITVLMPNQDTPEVGGARWAKYLTNVAQIEKQTGYRFFSSLPGNLQKVLKAKTDSGRASNERDTDEQASARSTGAVGSVATIQIPPPGDPAMIHSETPEGALQPRVDEGQDTGGDLSGGALEGRASGGTTYQPPLVDEQPQIEQQPATSGQVWVNTRSGVYHYPGARWYGNTKSGEYMSEAAANAQGYRAAQNGQ